MTFEQIEDREQDAICAIKEMAMDCEAKTCALHDIRILCENANVDNWQSVIERIQELIWRNR
jgi:hypothetical protein